MRPLRIVLSPRSSYMLEGSHLLAAAALLVAAIMLLAYVQLLHEAVDRGARFRAQALPAPQAPMLAQRDDARDLRLRPILAVGALPAGR